VALAPARHVLPNGVTLLVQENATTPAVSVLIAVGAGAACEGDEAAGTTALIARLLDRGTSGRSGETIADELDRRGASLSVGAGRHMLTVACTCLAEDLDVVLSLAAEILQAPSFPPQDIETRRGELLTAILEAEDDPGSVAVDGLLAALYPAGHPYGRPTRGRAETVRALSREALVAFHARWVGPATTTVVVVGDIDREQVHGLAARVFGPWAAPTPPAPVVAAAPGPTARHLVVRPMPDKAQADLAYGFVGLSRLDPDYYAALVMNNALGQYALGGRLGDSIRERQGMAYYVFSSLDANLAPGPVMIRAGIAGANVERTIVSVDAELETVRGEGFTPREVAESKQYLVGSLPRQLETNAGIAGFLLTTEIFGLGADHDVRLPGLVDAVTADQVNAAARRLLDPARAAVVVAGPWEGPVA
jgi:zinc protease